MADVFALQLDPNKPDQYLFDGQPRPLTKRDMTVEIKTADGTLRELTEEVRQFDSFPEMARLVSQKVDAALHPERLYLFYREEGRRDLSLGYSSGGLSRDLHIPAEFELLRFLEYQGSALTFLSQPKPGCRYMRSSGWRVSARACSCRCAGRTTG
jgi:hypothetical protein